MSWIIQFIFYFIIADDTCSEEGPLGQYGISADTGDNRLKGPGIYQAPGASHMGGRMTYRLASMCEAYR